MTLRRAAPTIVTASGLLLLTACAAPAAGGSPVGTWGEDDPKPNVTIAEDGTISGTDGCNRLAGKGTIDGGTIDFGTLAVTRMACPDGTDVIDPWPAQGVVDGDELVLQDESGTEVHRLPRG